MCYLRGRLGIAPPLNSQKSITNQAPGKGQKALNRKLEITIRTSQLLTIRGSRSGRAWCQQCNAEQEVVTMETAVLLADSIATLLKAGSTSAGWHISQSPHGSPRICLPSLLRMLGSEAKATKATSVKGLLPEG
jgi:hypothetical protein